MGCRIMTGRKQAQDARHRAHAREAGFTYIGALVLVVVTGIALSSASQYWSTVMNREKEKELLFRGDQIRKAIDSYYKATPQGRQPSYPSRIEDLLKDPRSLESRRYLRRLYTDPMTNGKWGIISDGKGGIKGVFSLSEKAPRKSGGFPTGYESFESAKAYTDWKFVSNPSSATTSPGALPPQPSAPQAAGAKG
jgi:type II secretory pathway pseudopilin PulG